MTTKNAETLEQVQERHAEMLATAADLDLDLPEELKADFTDVAVGQVIASNLDSLIREYQAGKSPENSVASDDAREHNVTSPSKVAKKASKSAKKAAKKAAVSAGTKAEEKQVAKAAKKAKAKKTAKKAASTNSRQRVGFADDAKITKTGKDNPAREGSGKHERIANVLKHNGKTVKTYRASGGKLGTLGRCVEMGLVKVA